MTELHIVIRASRDTNNPDAGWTYVAVTAPMSWLAAQDVWTREDGKRCRAGVRMAESYLMVRSADDPRWLFLFAGRFADVNPYTGRSYHSRAIERAGRKVADLYGYQGRQGGWIYNRAGTAVCQGWFTFGVLQRNHDRIMVGADGRFYVPVPAQAEPHLVGA